MLRSSKKVFVGIDTGVDTGYAVWMKESKVLAEVTTTRIHIAMLRIKTLYELYGSGLLVRVEDARLRKWVTGGREKLQGAGSVKRDAGIWEDYLRWLGVDFELVAPKHNRTKMDAGQFKKVTGWGKTTSTHSRDAAMLVFGL